MDEGDGVVGERRWMRPTGDGEVNGLSGPFGSAVDGNPSFPLLEPAGEGMEEGQEEQWLQEAASFRFWLLLGGAGGRTFCLTLCLLGWGCRCFGAAQDF
jgi:hypothetical protein